jgi:hypothetical protein
MSISLSSNLLQTIQFLTFIPFSSLSHDRAKASSKAHTVRSRASSFRCEYPLLSLRSSTSFLHLLPRLPVTSIPPFIFPSINCCKRQLLCKMWPIQSSHCGENNAYAYRLLVGKLFGDNIGYNFYNIGWEGYTNERILKLLPRTSGPTSDGREVNSLLFFGGGGGINKN